MVSGLATGNPVIQASFFQNLIVLTNDLCYNFITKIMKVKTCNSEASLTDFNLVGLWHGTVAVEDFTDFDCRGLGVHIGTYEQAKAAIEDLHSTTGRLIQIKARVMNPIRLPDMGSFWSSPIRMITEIAKALGSASASRAEWDRNKMDAVHKKISDEWDTAFRVADKTIKRQYPFDDLSALKHECATRLVLQQNGFDGIVYANQFEGVLKRNDDALSASPFRTSGDSYVVFENEQLASTF